MPRTDSSRLGYFIEDRPTAADVRGGPSWPVVRLSPMDVALWVDADGVRSERAPRTPGERVELLCNEYGLRFTGIVRASHDVPAVAGTREVIVTLDGGPRRDVLTMLQSLVQDDRVRVERPAVVTRTFDDPASVRTTVSALFANRRRGRICAPGVRPRAIRAARIEPEQEMALQWEVDGAWPEPPFTIEIDGFNAVVRLPIERASSIDGYLAVPVPRAVTRTRSRWERRASAPSDARITFRHPLVPGLHVCRPLRDLSVHGLSLVTNMRNDVVFPGMEVPEIEVLWGDQFTFAFSGIVRHVSADLHGVAELAGVAIQPRTSEDGARWADAIDALHHPRTSTSGMWSRALWDMFARSGYFHLSERTEKDFSALGRAFGQTSQALAHAPELGCQVVWPSNRGVEASVSMLRVYGGTTLLYQLARQRGRTPVWTGGRGVLRDIYLRAIEHTQRDTQARWLIVWAHETARFTRLAHEPVARPHVSEGRAYVGPMRVLVGDAEAPSVLPPAGTEIALPTSSEIARIARSIARSRPHAYVEAHDFTPERFTLDAIASEWRAHGLVRERAVLVARVADEARAAAILESASDGIQLFGLLDLVRLFPLTEGGEAQFGPLLEATRSWYRTRGKRRFAYALESSDTEHARAAGLVPLGGAELIIMSTELLPELAEHVYETTAPRDVATLR